MVVQVEVVHDLFNNFLHVDVHESLRLLLRLILERRPGTQVLHIGAGGMSVFIPFIVSVLATFTLVAYGGDLLIRRPIDSSVSCMAWCSDDLRLETLRAGSSGQCLGEQILVEDVVPFRAETFFSAEWLIPNLPESALLRVGSRWIVSNAVLRRDANMYRCSPCLVYRCT
jgi:hypothetical protein